MRLPLVFAALLAATVVSVPSFAQTAFVATIEASQVVGGTSSTASGGAAMVLSAAEDTLTYSLVLTGLDLDGLQTPAEPDDDVTALHFHAAPAGSNGGIVFGLISPNHDTDDLVINAAAGTLDGIWENTDTNPLSGQLANLKSRGLYLNVHTSGFPGGAIRGQVLLLIFQDGFETGDFSGWDNAVP